MGGWGPPPAIPRFRDIASVVLHPPVRPVMRARRAPMPASGVSPSEIGYGNGNNGNGSAASSSGAAHFWGNRPQTPVGVHPPDGLHVWPMTHPPPSRREVGLPRQWIVAVGGMFWCEVGNGVCRSAAGRAAALYLWGRGRGEERGGGVVSKVPTYLPAVLGSRPSPGVRQPSLSPRSLGYALFFCSPTATHSTRSARARTSTSWFLVGS